MGGENLGIMTIRVVDAGSAVSTSPGGGALVRMPSQVQLPHPRQRVASVVSTRQTPSFENVAGVIAQSTTNPYGAAVGAASMVGGSSIAGPMMIVGAAATAIAGAVLLIKGAASNLVGRVAEIGRFGPQTLQAMMLERVSEFRRNLYRSGVNDAAFSNFQESLTNFRDTLTPYIGYAEGKFAKAISSVLTATTAGMKGALAAVIAAAVADGNTELAEWLKQFVGMGTSFEPNEIFQRQLDLLTRGRAFGWLGPAQQPYLTRP